MFELPVPIRPKKGFENQFKKKDLEGVILVTRIKSPLYVRPGASEGEKTEAVLVPWIECRNKKGKPILGPTGNREFSWNWVRVSLGTKRGRGPVLSGWGVTKN